MAEKRGYGQFCPIALAAEMLAEQWMPLIIRELLCGSVRFNDGAGTAVVSSIT